jgi:hypothetical protein
MSTVTGTETGLSGGMMRQKKVARPARPVRPVRAVAAMAKPKKAPVRQRAYDQRLLKHFGGFFSELEGFAEQMSKVEHLTPAAKRAANFTNPPATPATPSPATPATPSPMSAAHGMPPAHGMTAAQNGGYYMKKRRPVVKRGPARRQSRGGTGLEEEFGAYEDGLKTSMAVVNSMADPLARSLSLGGARGRARAPRVSPAYRASYHANPVVRRARRAASPRRR